MCVGLKCLEIGRVPSFVDCFLKIDFMSLVFFKPLTIQTGYQGG